MRDLAPGTFGALVELEVRDVRIGHNGGTLLSVQYLSLTGPGPTMILGPNGAGKSLLLRCLHGLIRPDSGSVTQNGVAVGDTVRQKQAMVFQTPVLLRRSVAANLDFVLKRQGLTRGERRVRMTELLEEGGLAAKARQSARSLSGGEAQRLAILRALACAPEVLFLDEPTSALDPAATKEIEAMILAASDQGVRIIMVTHDIGQARRLAADVVLMQGGKVAEQGPAAHVLETPRSAAGQRFLAGALMI